ELTNPDNSQHQQEFVSVSSEQDSLTIVNYSLNEYDMLRDGRNTIDVTLLLSVGELGDWGYFLMPEAQCLGEHTVSFAIYLADGKAVTSYKQAYQYQIPWSTWQAGVQYGSLEAEGSFIDWQGENIAFSSVKVSNTTGDMMLRWFNIKNEET